MGTPPFSYLCSPETPLAISIKFETDNYIGHASLIPNLVIVRLTETCPHISGVVIPVVYFYPFYLLTFLLTCRDRIVCRRNVGNGSKEVFLRILVPIRDLVNRIY